MKSLFCVAAGLLLTFMLGCTAPETPSYALHESVAELPEKHQQQLRQSLEEYFGTPTDPRARRPESLEPDDEGQIALTDAIDPLRLRHGAEQYRRFCAGCHGVTGDGLGVAAAHLDPKPRDYRRGIFKFTSTPRGAKPRRADLVRIIRYGAKGTSMPSFPWMSDDDLQAVVDYVISLSQRGELEILLVRESQLELEPEDDYDPRYVAEYVEQVRRSWDDAADQIVLPLTPPPRRSEETIALGARIFLQEGCAKCHGDDGRGGRRPGVTEGDTPLDDWGHVAYAADLTSGMLHGGRRPVDIYRRIFSGINGTPMPGFGQTTFSEHPELLWPVVHFVESVVDGRTTDIAAAAAQAAGIDLPLPSSSAPAEPPAETPTETPTKPAVEDAPTDAAPPTDDAAPADATPDTDTDTDT